MAQVKPKAPAAKVPAKPEDLWHEARLIPITAVGGPADQEQRATSALLAVLRGVPEFGRALLAQVGRRRGGFAPTSRSSFPTKRARSPGQTVP